MNSTSYLERFQIAPAELERQIPIVWVDEETMEKKVGARDCIWRIEWLESDKLDDELEEKDQFSFYLDNEIEDVLEIWFNEKFEYSSRKMRRLGLRSSLHKKQISAEIYSEIFRRFVNRMRDLQTQGTTRISRIIVD